MKNAFHWQGEPSIFTTGEKPKNFGENMTRRNLEISMRKKVMPASLPGSSPYLAPDMMLGRNPRRSKK